MSAEGDEAWDAVPYAAGLSGGGPPHAAFGSACLAAAAAKRSDLRMGHVAARVVSVRLELSAARKAHRRLLTDGANSVNAQPHHTHKRAMRQPEFPMIGARWPSPLRSGASVSISRNLWARGAEALTKGFSPFSCDREKGVRWACAREGLAGRADTPCRSHCRPRRPGSWRSAATAARQRRLPRHHSTP